MRGRWAWPILVMAVFAAGVFFARLEGATEGTRLRTLKSVRAGPSVTPPAATAEAANPAVAASAPYQAAALSTSTVFTAPWGDSAGSLGHRLPNEGAPEGPMSFAVDERGGAWVLDQVNSRVELFAPGEAPRAIPLPRESFQDVVANGPGGLIALDRLRSGTIAFLDASGRIASEIPVAGRGVAEGGGVTGLFRYGDGVWVEYAHQSLVRIADSSGRADATRPTLPGRLSLDGSRVIRAARLSPTSVGVYAWPAGQMTGDPALFGTVPFGMTQARIWGLDTDAKGRVFVTANVIEERQSPPFETLRQTVEVVVLGAGGVIAKRTELSVPEGPEEQFRPIQLGPDGALYHLSCNHDGVSLTRTAL